MAIGSKEDVSDNIHNKMKSQCEGDDKKNTKVAHRKTVKGE